MNRTIILGLTGAAAALIASGGAGALPAVKALAGIAGGLWEVDGVPGHRAPIRTCVAEPLQLAYVEHGKAKCTPTILGDSPPNLRLSYQCTGGGFGQASVKAITPRSLRLDVQGIADGAPYNYVMQARRIGDCPAVVTPGKPERGH